MLLEPIILVCFTGLPTDFTPAISGQSPPSTLQLHCDAYKVVFDERLDAFDEDS